jgi:molybdate transport system substrate-binding protein
MKNVKAYADGAIAAGLAVALWSFGPAEAAEVKLIGSNALKTALEELAPAFEKATGHKIAVVWGAAVPLKARIEMGAAFDLTVLPTPAIEDLVSQGKLAAGTQATLAHSGIGVAVRKGAPKPDIGTTEAFKRALLNAKSIAYVEQGGTGIYLKALLPRLGLADALKDRTKLLPPENPAAHAIANGEAELGMTQVSEILPYAGAELVGPFPAEIQLTTTFAVGIAAGTKEADVAKALVRFLTAPGAGAVFKAKGLDPAS